MNRRFRSCLTNRALAAALLFPGSALASQASATRDRPGKTSALTAEAGAPAGKQIADAKPKAPL